MSEVLFFVKLFCYIWAFVEVASTANLYNYASGKMTDSPIIRALFWFLTASAFALAYRFLLNYTVSLTPVFHNVFRDGVIIPLVFTAITARHFKEQSLSNGLVKKLRKEKNEKDCTSGRTR